MQVCSGTDKNFVVINQKGIDPPSLDLLARAGVTNSDLFHGSNLLTSTFICLWFQFSLRICAVMSPADLGT
jgi:hypothetical protein